MQLLKNKKKKRLKLTKPLIIINIKAVNRANKNYNIKIIKKI